MASEQFVATFKCTNCEQAGDRTWEESSTQSRFVGEGRTLVCVSSGFHIETGRTATGEPLIVCNECDEIQPD
jgi:hypothetical protein